MKLDFNRGTASFILRVARGGSDSPDALMREYGFDLSLPASTAHEAVLFTKEPYAAVPFFDIASIEARAELEAINAEIESSRAPTDGGHYRIPADLELWPFQKASLAYALRRNHTLIGDQPGLGKTQIAIAYANEIGAKRVLVICPASIRPQWVKRIREWTTMPYPFHVHMILNGRNGVHPTAAWTVVSYELARSEAIGKALAKGTYDCLILDEAHYLKATDSRRTRAIFGGGDVVLFEPLATRCGSILALTGTPLPNRPREAYTLSRALNWDAIDWMSEDKFKDRFNPSARIERYDEATGKTKFYVDERVGRHGELQARLRGNFMTRHLKREVMTQLKPPIYDLIYLDDDSAAIKAALAAEDLLGIDPDELEGADIEVLGDISTVRMQMGIAMAPLVADHVKMLIDGGEEKLVLFAWHIEVLNILMERLSKFNPIRIDGSTGAMRKQKLVDRFIDTPPSECNIIMGNVLSMGTGTDGLQKVAWHALLAEPDWVNGNNQQCFDRLDRGGQANVVLGDIFLVKNSLAEKVLAKALRKGQSTHRALDERHAL